MNLLGITQELEADAARRCPGGFRAWIGEMRRAEWRDARRMMAAFPRCLRLGGARYRFVLGPGDIGIEADVFFEEELQLVLADRIVVPAVQVGNRADRESSPVFYK
jgi:hypothetical protein